MQLGFPIWHLIAYTQKRHLPSSDRAPAMPNLFGVILMKSMSMQHIPLAAAYLCPNCSCIGNCSEQCPACASSALLGLASVLDRNDNDDSRRGYSRVHALAA
jgi:hypothetical protein